MEIFPTMARPLTESFTVSLLVAVSAVLGCGVIPAVQTSTRTFNVSRFTLPVSMAYSTEAGVRARVPGIAADMNGARAFVSSLVMQTIFDVLERQARSALLPDAAISAILSQLEVRVAYEPLQCKIVVSPGEMLDMMKESCIIVDNTVTGICTTTNMKKSCTAAEQTTTNIVMANWSAAMWQNVVNRAIRTLATGPFGSHFFSATATAS
ncbi:hypothetical protein KIN20_003702 [Parelaphostrongylus tenuis]|uniref:Uncharacterized protein n=1 Tax=Parelaphostrongylus tenuis TaxID=148309 RepID=A0AAD5LXA3_PARTN|nr:hypothetical protein KIN20_003702 [Parelaphostrongylus tenuis]